MRLGLGRTRALLDGLGNPERTVRGALVAGTNGKGSVLALADSALRAAGYRVGSTPKPHLVSYRERIQVDGRPIAADDFSRLVSRVLEVSDAIAPRHGEPTEFELLTAVVFARFAEVRPDVALVEVGLGGRLDATHAWDGGVAVVTNVDLDHTDRLGDTVTAIAREKAAIIERGDLAVTGARRGRAGGRPPPGAPARRPADGGRAGALARLGPRRHRGRAARAGAHPGRAARASPGGERGDRRCAARRPRGGRDRQHPGRGTTDRLCHGHLARAPRAAHASAAGTCCSTVPTTRPGAAALAIALDDLRPFLADGPLTLITASMADKDVDGVIAALDSRRTGRRHDRLHEPGRARGQWTPRSWRRAGARSIRTARSSPSRIRSRRWIGRFGDRAGNGPLVVAGSLYLVGAARGHLVDDPDLRDPDPSEDA